MTISHDLLGNKLNDFKNNKEDPKKNNDNVDSLKSSLTYFTNTCIILITLIFKSIIYGYSFKLIFCTEWNFIQFVCIGLAFNFLTQFFYALVHKIQ